MRLCLLSLSFAIIMALCSLFDAVYSLSSVVKSIQRLARVDSKLDWVALDTFVNSKQLEDYKNWDQTSLWAKELESILGGPDDDEFKHVFARVLKDGNWHNAQVASASSTTNRRPWVVLVTGLNGIRKTTALHQPWFRSVLKEALGDSLCSDKEIAEDAISTLPAGDDSFYRQLDYMIAAIANEEFQTLYCEAAAGLSTSHYSSKKDGIFKRNRTIAEILGVLLLRSAQSKKMNTLVETSGRDIASFDYIDTIFAPPLCPTSYRKLALHFSINEICHAEQSVDSRMAAEMKEGGALVAAGSVPVPHAVVAVNSGGPYGSEVLKSVQADAEHVWASVLEDKAGQRSDWLKASILIQGSSDPASWTARAVCQDESLGKNVYPFKR